MQKHSTHCLFVFVYLCFSGVPGDWAQRARLVVRELMGEPCASGFLSPVDEEEVGALALG